MWNLVCNMNSSNLMVFKKVRKLKKMNVGLCVVNRS
jgi:hypothetical protein